MTVQCWTITAGNPGMKSQVQGIAEAVAALLPDCQVTHYTAKRRMPWSWLPVRFYQGALKQLTPESDRFAPPWPDLLITSGRRAVPLALAIQQASGQQASGQQESRRKTCIIHTQKPYVPPARFDLLVLPEHDRMQGPNIVTTRWALHKVTDAKLAEHHAKFAPFFAHYSRPYLAILLGGSTNKYHLSPTAMDNLIQQITQMVDAWQGSILITPSYRTGADNIARLRSYFASNPRVYIYDMVQENPYMGMLALADSFAVTDDSVNMISEACYTGKPVYILPMLGQPSSRPKQFVEKLLQDGITRIFPGHFEQWEYAPARDTEKAAKAVVAHYLARG